MPLLTGLKQQRPSVTFAIELEPALGLRCLSGKYRAGLRNRVEPVLRFFLADLAHVPVLSGAARRPCPPHLGSDPSRRAMQATCQGGVTLQPAALSSVATHAPQARIPLVLSQIQAASVHR